VTPRHFGLVAIDVRDPVTCTGDRSGVILAVTPQPLLVAHDGYRWPPPNLHPAQRCPMLLPQFGDSLPLSRTGEIDADDPKARALQRLLEGATAAYEELMGASRATDSDKS
jgi:hypothetical protein